MCDYSKKVRPAGTDEKNDEFLNGQQLSPQPSFVMECLYFYVTRMRLGSRLLPDTLADHLDSRPRAQVIIDGLAA